MKEYDAIVVGSGNSGLISALSLLNEGNKVLLLEANNNIGGLSRGIVKGKFEFESSIHNLYLKNGNNSYKIDNIFKKLDIEDEIRFSSLPEVAKIITPNNSYTIPFGVDNFIEKMDEWFIGCRESVNVFFDLARECREALDYVVNNLDKLDYDKIKEKYNNFMRISNNSVSKVLDAINMPLNAQELINSLWMYFGSTETEISFVEYSVFLLNVLECGLQVPNDRSYGVSLTIANRFLEKGGEIRLNNEVANLVIEDGKVNGVRLTDGTLIYADKVVVNSSLHNVYGNLINPEDVPRKALKNVNKREIGARTLTVHLGLNRSASDLKLYNYSYILLDSLDSDAEYTKMLQVSNNNQIAIVHNNAINNVSPNGTCMISLTTMFFEDAFGEYITEEKYHTLVDDIVTHLIDIFQKRTGVIIQDYIEEIHVVTPLDYASISKVPSGSIFGYRLKGLDNLLSRLLNRHNENYIDGLTICGGFDGDAFAYNSSLVSGIMASDDLLKNEGEK